MALGATQVQAADVIKAATGTDLSLPASWTTTTPTASDVATWNNAAIPGGTFTLNSTASAATTWGGMKVTAAAAAIVITGGNTGQTLNFGSSGLIAGSKSVTFGDATANTPTVNVSVDQTWTINLKVVLGGANLTVDPAVTTGGWIINLNNVGSGNPPLDVNGGTSKTYDLSKAKLTGIGYPKLSTGTLKLAGTNDFDGVTQITGNSTCEFTTLANAGTASSFGDGAGSASTAVISLGGVATLRNTGAGGATNRPITATNTSSSSLTLENNGSGAIAFNSTSAIGGTGGVNILSLKGTYASAINTLAQSFTATSISKVFDDSSWSLSGTNTVGSVEVKKGVLELASTGAVGTAAIATTNAGAEVRIGGGLNINNNINFTGGLTSTLSSTSASTSTYSGTATLSSTAATATQASFKLSPATGSKLLISGLITGSCGNPLGTGSVRKLGAGIAELSTANNYDVETVVLEGTLLVTNSTGSATSTKAVTVNAVGASLAGTGTIAGDTIITTGGNISPGTTSGSIGTLNFGNNLTIHSASSYTVDVTGTSTCDKVNVTGTFACNGTITINPNSHTFAVGDHYDVADATTISGTPTISPASPGTGLAWDTSAFISSGVISVVVSDPFVTWASQITNPADRDRTDDPDGDGFNNIDEYLLGTLPTSANGSLTTTEASGSNLIIRWKELVSGGTYTLESSSTLNNDWVTATGATLANDGAASSGYQPRMATIPLTGTKKFFRIQAVEN